MRATFGVDIRTPAFDRRLAEFCIGIPEDQYLRNGQDRWLIRRAMRGQLPEDMLASKNRGAQSADWFPRLTRERNHIAEELKRLGKNADVASIIDLRRLVALVDDWPDRQPPEFSFEARPLAWALPQALGAAFFIESVTGLNDPNFVSGESA
jgi:asparagine synthase (glutamine-hydrolysing)